ncbi:hypothetical protein R8Z50_12780 [Longispora sp. K20-0274]|uniref:hypothetical protein n=1 Tax=Longispora sp. K20-0274 TaxID=3088255 RepID=UPI00399A899F
MEALTYTAGNEHNPTDPFGRILLEITGDGEVRFSRYARTGDQHSAAHASADLLARLRAALATAGFPVAPTLLPRPGDRLRQLTVTGDPAGVVRLPWYEAAKLPGYSDLFALLDDLVARLSADPPPADLD